jgi:hypothetical protein
MIEALALMWSFGTGCPTPLRRETRLLLSPTGGSETPLPETLAPTGLQQTPTQAPLPSRAIAAELASVGRVLSTTGILRVDGAAQARVDEILLASARQPTTKRLLSRRSQR